MVPVRPAAPKVLITRLVLALAVAAGAPKLAEARKTPAQIAPYPPMQWHSFGQFNGILNEANMLQIAGALTSSGMAAAGYDTINVVCNGWVGRDPATGELLENRTLWPTGIKGFATKLHSMTPPLKLGCYTAPREKNCMCFRLPSGGCEEGTGLGHEAIDMAFFAAAGCDHVMVDMPDGPSTAAAYRARYRAIGDGIRASSNPDMVYGVWSGPSGYSWKWASAADVGGHYWRIGDDMYDGWQSLMRMWDTLHSIANINQRTQPGAYTFLDQMLVGDVPGRAGSVHGPVPCCAAFYPCMPHHRFIDATVPFSLAQVSPECVVIRYDVMPLKCGVRTHPAVSDAPCVCRCVPAGQGCRTMKPWRT